MVLTKNGWRVFMPTGSSIYFDTKEAAAQFYMDTAIYKANMAGLFDAKNVSPSNETAEGE